MVGEDGSALRLIRGMGAAETGPDGKAGTGKSCPSVCSSVPLKTKCASSTSCSKTA